jgi:hypothetical protein
MVGVIAENTAVSIMTLTVPFFHKYPAFKLNGDIAKVNSKKIMTLSSGKCVARAPPVVTPRRALLLRISRP